MARRAYAHGTRGISADTALRLARYFGTSEQLWMNLQARFDLEVERERPRGRPKKEVLGARARQLNFGAAQRLSSAAGNGVPPLPVGCSEGLACI